MEKLTEMRTFFNELAQEYDKRITGKADADMEGKQLVASFLPPHTRSIIDFGIGTGLELGAIFARFPEAEVTGLDIAEDMLHVLKSKYPNRNLRLCCENYHDYDFGREQYDAALSIKTFHHYGHSVKTALYQRIHSCLKADGVYIECDKMAFDQAEEDFHFAEYERLKHMQGICDNQAYHFDTPCTVSNQIKMLYAAGFSNVNEAWRKESTRGLIVILVAKK